MKRPDALTGDLRARGFTLVELLIVIVIVSILAAIAVPSYRQYVMRTNRTVVKGALQDLLSRQESYAVDHKVYASTFGSLGIGAAANTNAFVTSDGKISDTNSGTAALYQFSMQTKAKISSSCAVSTPTSGPSDVVLIAAPIGSNQDTTCGTLCLSSNGDRGAALGTVADCWRR